jgi:hypothetical protein
MNSEMRLISRMEEIEGFTKNKDKMNKGETTLR